MSGQRLFSFREGDRSELLADYLLSSIGLTTPIRRQDDIGFDFYCQLADQETGLMTFGSPYVVQIKSNNSTIQYGVETPDKWNRNSIDWLFRLNIPFLIGIVNRKKIKIDIYNTSPLWEVYHLHRTCSIIEFKFREEGNISKVGFPQSSNLADWPVDKGDGKKYIIDLGKPVITISNDDIEDKQLLKYKKNLLQRILMIEEENILYKKANIKFFRWIIDISGNSTEEGWSHAVSTNVDFTPELYKSLSPGLIALIINLKINNKNEELEKILEVIKLLPKDTIYPELKEYFPNIFK